MKRLFYLSIIATFLISACNNKCIEDFGVQTTRTSQLKVFDKIDVSGAIKLVIVQDSTYAVSIQADSNFIKHVDADVSSNTLKLKLKREYCGADSVVVTAGIGELKKLSTGGAVTVSNEGQLNLGDFEMDLEGNTKAVLKFNAAKVNTNVDGIAELTLSGQAGAHELTTKGNAKINAFEFVVGMYDLNIDGVGKANINVLNELKVETSGASEIYYRGNPKKVNEKKTGAAKLEKVN